MVVWPANWYGTSGLCSNGSDLGAPTKPPPGIIRVSYQCHSMACLDKPSLEFGDKIILPQAAFKEAHRLRLGLPLLFKVVNSNKRVVTAGPSPFQFCGVLEFSAPRDQVFLPYWMMQNLIVAEGERVELRNIHPPPPGAFVRFRPHDEAFLSLATRQGPKALMEDALRRYTVLSEGVSILVQHEGCNFYLDVMEIRTLDDSAPNKRIVQCSGGRDNNEREKECIDVEDRAHAPDKNVADSVSGSCDVGGKRVDLVSLLGDIDLEVEFCSRRMGSSSTGRASDRTLKEATGAVVQENPSVCSRVSEYITGPTTDVYEKCAGLLALPPPARARARGDCSAALERTQVLGAGQAPSPAAPMRSLRFRAFSGKGVVLGSAPWGGNGETMRRDKGDRDWLMLEQEKRTNTGAPTGKIPRNVDEEALGVERGNPPDVDLIADDGIPLSCRGLGKSVGTVGEVRENISPSVTNAPTRIHGGVETLRWNATSEAEAFACGSCGRYVPTANRVLHELRCSSTSGRARVCIPQVFSRALSTNEIWGLEQARPTVTERTESKEILGHPGTWRKPTSTLDAELASPSKNVDNSKYCPFQQAESLAGSNRGFISPKKIGTGNCQAQGATRVLSVSHHQFLLRADGHPVFANMSFKSFDSPCGESAGEESLQGFGSEGGVLPPRWEDLRGATPPLLCPFCSLSLRGPGAAAAHEKLYRTRTESCPHCGGQVQRWNIDFHRKPGGGCDVAIAAAMTEREEAMYTRDIVAVNAATVTVGGCSGGDFYQSGYEMRRFDASLVSSVCSSRVTVPALTSVDVRNDYPGVSALEPRCRQRRGRVTGAGGGGGDHNSTPMLTTKVEAAGDKDAPCIISESKGNGFRSDQHSPGRCTQNESCRAVRIEAITNGDSSWSSTEGTDTAPHQRSRIEGEVSKLPLFHDYFPGESESLIYDGLIRDGEETVHSVVKADGVPKYGGSGHLNSHAGGFPVFTKAPATGDTNAFSVGETRAIDHENATGGLGVGEAIQSTRQRWACWRCTLLNTLCVEACDACGAVKSNATVERQNEQRFQVGVFHRGNLVPPGESIAKVPSEEQRHVVDPGSEAVTGEIPGHQALTNMGSVRHSDDAIAATTGFLPEVYNATVAGPDRSGSTCRNNKLHAFPSLTSSRKKPLVSRSSESQTRKLVNDGRDPAGDGGAVARVQAGSAPLPPAKTAYDSTATAVRESRKSDGSLATARVPTAARFTRSGKPSGAVGTKTLSKRPSAGANGATQSLPIYNASHNNDLRVRYRRGIVSRVDGFYPNLRPSLDRGTLVAAEDKRPLHRDRDSCVPRRQGIITSRPRSTRSTAIVRMRRCQLGGFHQPPIEPGLRHFPLFVSPTQAADGGAKPLRDTALGDIPILAGSHSKKSVLSHSPGLKSTRPREGVRPRRRWQQQQQALKTSETTRNDGVRSIFSDENSTAEERTLAVTLAADSDAPACDRYLPILGNGRGILSDTANERARWRENREPPPTERGEAYSSSLRGSKVEQRGKCSRTGLAPAKLRRRF